uniref:non-specific serine/threonine protein kinase n=1 Tax=Clastoptera arizonana TaxID=38151 RepID=A0A1B6DMU1_9HEMI
MEGNPNFTILKQGAEGKIYKGIYLEHPTIVKERFKKLYRHPVLDDQLCKERIKAEARAIVKSKGAGVRTPALYLVDFERRCIFMEDIVDSMTVKDYINKILQNEDHEKREAKIEKLANEIGMSIGKLHKKNIVHGDLTTSNMLIRTDSDDFVEELCMIDFGLSHTESKIEDKGVDLYVLERAMQSTHPNADVMFKIILNAYKSINNKDSSEVCKKLEEVRARGRKRTMVG